MIIFRRFDITDTHSQKIAGTQGSVMELMLSTESVSQNISSKYNVILSSGYDSHCPGQMERKIFHVL